MLSLGLRKVPIVYRNGTHASGQNLDDVARMIGVNGTGFTQLPPDQLIEKWLLVLGAGLRYLRQMPEDKLAEDVIPNRRRAIRLLCHHIYRIPESFLETAIDGVLFDAGTAGRQPPDDRFHRNAELAQYGEDVMARLRKWWEDLPDKSCRANVATYFGTKSTHVLLERCAWHSAQHVRQIIAVLERFGIEPDKRLTAQDLAGLPLPERLWE